MPSPLFSLVDNLAIELVEAHHSYVTAQRLRDYQCAHGSEADIRIAQITLDAASEAFVVAERAYAYHNESQGA